MKKKLLKYAKMAIAMALIASLTLPSYATVGASDGSAFVTKAEFDAALSDFNARLTTFEAGINSKIDSQVSSYLDRNGIWSGKEQDFSFQWKMKIKGNGVGAYDSMREMALRLQNTNLYTYSGWDTDPNDYLADKKATKSGLLFWDYTFTASNMEKYIWTGNNSVLKCNLDFSLIIKTNNSQQKVKMYNDTVSWAQGDWEAFVNVNTTMNHPNATGSSWKPRMKGRNAALEHIIDFPHASNKMFFAQSTSGTLLLFVQKNETPKITAKAVSTGNDDACYTNLWHDPKVEVVGGTWGVWDFSNGMVY